MSEALLIDELRAVVGERGVVVDANDLENYNVDWRHMFKGRARCAVLPRSTSEVAQVVRLCAGKGISIVPYGGNTGLSGGATPDGSGSQVVLSLARMNAIRDIDALGETMEVEAGCILQTAQEAATQAGLMLPISLAAEGSARIGGLLSTNAGGTNVLRYGMSRTRVLGLEVVTADGEIVSGLRRLRKDNAGYDWKQLFIGAEGTLGIITAAVLQLAPQSCHRVTALLAVPTPDAALKVLRAARQHIGETLNAFELMSGAALELVARHQGLKTPLAASEWFVLVEASSCLAGLRDAVEGLFATVLEEGDATDGVIAESERQEGELWLLRESITEAESREGRSLKHDVSVPIAGIPAFLREADAAVAQAFPGSRVNAFGHAGDGNIHYNVIVSPAADGHALNMLVHDLVVRHGGSISAEHGIGQYRVSELQRCRAPSELRLAGRIKRALDPAGTMNPGKVMPLISQAD
ncbi:FAD-binding oxidoreductase [Variovorax paradoxus]|uniref:Putative FAD-linked oxidoreductase n=1 Tax=Variovorax paradoxus TaxID=34073 RepID=A0A0H2LR40_VARPD|nr:FAD-binding oxidoreductase [Variovorax paradoxus]KLN52704.1 putative FAD-linked oxidoreductase [Variovorax paradoxus]